MIEEELRLKYRIKIALALHELKRMNADHNRKLNLAEPDADYKNSSYEKIATEVDIRSATVSDLFNFNDDSKISTLVATIVGMNRTMTEFGEVFDTITEKQIAQFLKKKEKSKTGKSKKKCRLRSPHFKLAGVPVSIFLFVSPLFLSDQNTVIDVLNNYESSESYNFVLWM
ncbi:MAG: hypothetical protein KL787_01225 [Taibaiella sp.]|nr:hypothetical protein [Taibaiella sp.]